MENEVETRKDIITQKERLKQVIHLSIPAILAQVSSIIMQYIDAAMAGSLGAEATAAIGLVSSTTWLFGGFALRFPFFWRPVLGLWACGWPCA